ncbi:MAG: hypothetical protein ISS73_01795 [Pirellulales bacterium]|nr:hypothetical protein [Pirellulales bacterium]
MERTIHTAPRKETHHTDSRDTDSRDTDSRDTDSRDTDSRDPAVTIQHFSTSR